MRIQSVGLVTCASLLLVFAGCPGGGAKELPDLVPVGGTVMLDGEPLSGATVTFIPVGATRGRACTGLTDASGRYEIKADAGHKGAPVGEFQVTCAKWVMEDGSDFHSAEGLSPLEAGAQEKLPPKYSSETETELKATVPAGGSDSINFELSSAQQE
ncbi:MAG TPA: carboxypeptidase regulatory-like domain-containing protein [Thermoguttaceae bacterium]|nr:carboxypeptidase regulatory-like domain-containing protein [Thermoguttaceae bacterium]